MANRKYITGIDGMRSIAVIGVIIYHLLPDKMPGGYLGVPLFFVISGYLMTDILLSEWANRQKIKLLDFYRRRARRIYPSLILLFLVFGSIAVFLPKTFLNDFRGITTTSLLNVNNFWQIINGASYFDRFTNHSSFTHLWSLSIEGQFYLTWPIIVAITMFKDNSGKLLKRLTGILIILSASAMIILYTPESINRVYYGTDTRLFSILMGAYLSLWMRENSLKLKKFRMSAGIWMFLSTFVLIILGFVFLGDTLNIVYRGGMFVFSLVSTLFLFTIIQSPFANRVMTNVILKWIGTRSYEIYLVQFPVMIIYESLMKLDGSLPWLHFTVQIILILSISELFYQLVFLLRHYEIDLSNLKTNFGSVSQKIGASLVIISMILFSVSFVQASTGKTEDSLKLQKQLEENQKLVETKNKENKPKPEDSKTTKTTETKETTSSSEKEKEKSETESTEQKSEEITPEEYQEAQQLNISAIGDSVLLSAAPSLQTIFPKLIVDAEVGRQFNKSSQAVKKLVDNNQLGDAVIIVLGTNGAFSSNDVDNLMGQLGDRPVFFVNTMVERYWQKSVNDELNQTVQRYKNAHLFDWKTASAGHNDWLEEDNVHMNKVGAENFSKLLANQVIEEVDE
ncbi:acyltransferase family protein [Vagococcus silagei]|uniref:Acetyltransferase n=1 Tax=Vagococcus silagei TaxID=2508885 RepID=A0A4S3B4B8_9ENTE|nr:acyltransferase family protein [Vagococcus silagei]THB61662.1 acetyltransferase [Vagococcus silagei]